MSRAPKDASLVPIGDERRGWEQAVAADVLPAGTSYEPTNIAGIAAEIVTSGMAAGTILHLHGGGYSAGSPRTHRKFAARLAKASGWRLVVPDYRLAPEHPFPAGLDDAVAVYGALRAQHGRLVVSGDSAGGGLATALLFEARRLSLAMPQGLVLLSPQGDLTYSGASFRTDAAHPNPSPADLERSAALYAGTRDRTDPLLSPVFGDFTGFPPMLVLAGGHEVFVDDSIRIVERAKGQGIAAHLSIAPGLWHAYPLFDCPEADAAITECAAFVTGSS